MVSQPSLVPPHTIVPQAPSEAPPELPAPSEPQAAAAWGANG